MSNLAYNTLKIENIRLEFLNKGENEFFKTTNN